MVKRFLAVAYGILFICCMHLFIFLFIDHFYDLFRLVAYCKCVRINECSFVNCLPGGEPVADLDQQFYSGIRTTWLRNELRFST